MKNSIKNIETCLYEIKNFCKQNCNALFNENFDEILKKNNVPYRPQVKKEIKNIFMKKCQGFYEWQNVEITQENVLQIYQTSKRIIDVVCNNIPALMRNCSELQTELLQILELVKKDPQISTSACCEKMNIPVGFDELIDLNRNEKTDNVILVNKIIKLNGGTLENMTQFSEMIKWFNTPIWKYWYNKPAYQYYREKKSFKWFVKIKETVEVSETVSVAWNLTDNEGVKFFGLPEKYKETRSVFVVVSGNPNNPENWELSIAPKEKVVRKALFDEGYIDMTSMLTKLNLKIEL